MENKIIIYKKGWEKKFKYLWDEMKLISMDIKGWNLSIVEKKAKEHNFPHDFLQSLTFRNLTTEKLFHTVGNTYFDEELEDGSYDTENNFNKMIKCIRKRVEEKGFVFVEIDAETWNLEDKSGNPILVKIEKGQPKEVVSK